MQYAAILVDALHIDAELLLEDVNFPVDGERRVLRQAVELVAHFLEQPRMSERCAPYHHGIHAVTLERLFGLFGRADVSVANDGYAYARVLLHAAYQSPVSFASVHLGAGASVYGQGLNAAVLQLFGKVFDDDVLRVPTKPCLHRYGHFHRVDNRPRYLQHQRNVAQHTCSGTLAGHLFHRTTEVKVNQIGLGRLHNLGRFGHRLCVAAVYLYAHGPLVVAYRQFRHGALDRPHKGFGAYKLGINHGRPEPLAQPSEADVSDIFHRSEEKRARPELYVADVHCSIY